MRAESIVQLRSVLLRRAIIIPAFVQLSDEDAGRLIKALCRFWNGEEVVIPPSELRTAFEVVASEMEDRAGRYLAKPADDQRRVSDSST